MNLVLVDTSNYIYAGSKNLWVNRGFIKDSFVEASAPCGGMAYVLNPLFEHNLDKDVVVYCIDSPPMYKRMIHEKYFQGGYKGNRKAPEKDIILQKKYIPEMLEFIGANVIKAEGYEADDIIASLIHYYKDDFEKIYIHTKDSDLYYLVDEKVEVLPLTKQGNLQNNRYGSKNYSNGKHIKLDNWRESVRKGILCPWNILTLLKILDGESGDNVPAVSNTMGHKIISNISRDEYPSCADNEYLRKRILEITNNDEHVRAVVDLIMPIILPYDAVQLYESDLNITRLMNIAKLCHSGWAQSWNYTNEEECNKFIDTYVTEYVCG
ncbi:MAG: hypothetical protein IJE43_19540 [Alphaproteobacteria bacterium]|nr:hypothetical protein [Alphaproteobacteria bacterium]